MPMDSPPLPKQRRQCPGDDGPADGSKTAWVIGIQDPSASMESGDYVDSVIANNISVVTSGDYQRYYMVDGVKVHHIIDGETLMPADRFSSVTIVCEDSGLADMLSTALFILPMEEGKALAEQHGAEVMWIETDGTVTCTDGLIPAAQGVGRRHFGTAVGTRGIWKGVSWL